MRDRHEPREEFVERLAERIRTEARRQTRVAPESGWTRWLLQSPIKAAAAVAVVVVASMGLGGMVVVAAYQAQTNEQRQLLLASHDQRVALATSRVAIAAEQVKRAEQRAAVGIDPTETVDEARFQLAEAEAQLKVAQLQLAEVQATGREPVTSVSAPVAGGRDFLTERWKTEMSVTMAALQLESARLKAAQRRQAVGVGEATEVELVRTRLIELEVSIVAFRQRIGIREQYLQRQLEAAMADLRVMEVEAEQRRRALEPRIAYARKLQQALQQKIASGTADPVELAEAKLRLQEFELELTRATMELAIIQRQIQQRRK